MTMIIDCHSDAAKTGPDLAAVKAKQQATWSSGDYAVIGTTLQIVGEHLAEAMDLRSGQKVLDVAAGNGNVTLAAARRWCDVTSTDYVPALLDKGHGSHGRDRLGGGGEPEDGVTPHRHVAAEGHGAERFQVLSSLVMNERDHAGNLSAVHVALQGGVHGRRACVGEGAGRGRSPGLEDPCPTRRLK